MATPSAREFLSKSKLAGLLRQLLSYGVKLPDLSPLAPVSNTTAAVLLDIRQETPTQLSLQLSGLRTIGQADVKQSHIISRWVSLRPTFPHLRQAKFFSILAT